MQVLILSVIGRPWVIIAISGTTARTIITKVDMQIYLIYLWTGKIGHLVCDILRRLLTPR